MDKVGRYDFEGGDSYRMVQLLAAQAHYARQTRNFAFIIMIASLASMAMFIAVLAGGLKTTGIMTRMDSQMSEMTGQMKDLTSSGGKFAEQLKGKFPENQAELTVKQVLGIIANGKSISERANELLGNVDDATIQHVAALAKSLGPAEVHALLGKAQDIMTSANTLLRAVDARKVNAVLTTFGNVKIEEINSLLKKVADLHEIKLQL